MQKSLEMPKSQISAPFPPIGNIFFAKKKFPQFLYIKTHWKNTGTFDFENFCNFQPYLISNPANVRNTRSVKSMMERFFSLSFSNWNDECCSIIIFQNNRNVNVPNFHNISSVETRETISSIHCKMKEYIS